MKEINKDISIRKLLKKVTKIKTIKFELCNYWDGDLCAIGLCQDDKVLYISSYNYINQEELKYDFFLEKQINHEKYLEIEKGEKLSFFEMIEKIKEIFDNKIKFKKLEKEINDILANWDPIGVTKPLSYDEYKSYIPQIIRNSKSLKLLKEFLIKLEKDLLGIEINQENLDYINKITQQIYYICNKL
ncbi:MAG: hypothetical protein GY830_08985 [Bacteroidetes bacterium]|nr:hypothetical protein [Bacteroidota bacterium]